MDGETRSISEGPKPRWWILVISVDAVLTLVIKHKLTLENKKFKKEALKVHSDKTGTNDDAEFKELLADFKSVQTALKEIEPKDEDDKGDVYTFFENNNVATEKSQSWTIVIEKNKVEAWSSTRLVGV